MLGHVFIEGSSTAFGMGDESGRLGYGGRFAHYYLDYSHNNYPKPLREGNPRWVYTHLNGQVNFTAVKFPYSFEQRVILAHEQDMFDKTVRLVGIFALGGRPEYIKQLDSEEKGDLWRDSLDMLEHTCSTYGVQPILLRIPEHDDAAVPLKYGLQPDYELRERVERITRERAQSMEAPYISFEEVVGDEKALCMAADHIHANARGYQMIFDHLLPLVNERLGIREPAFGNETTEHSDSLTMRN